MGEEEQQYQIPYGMPYPQSAPSLINPMSQHGSSIMTLTNPDKLMKKLELSYRSQIEINGEIVSKGDPLMNEAGINSILGQISSIVNQNTAMSNINKQEVPMLIDFLADTIIKDLILNRLRYDIKNKSSRDKVFFTALSTAFIMLKRPYEEGERRFWKGSQQEITTRVESDKQTNPFGWIMGRNKQ